MQRILFIVLFIILISCKQKVKQNVVIPTNKVEEVNLDTVPFYPYITAIEKEADSLIKNNVKFKLTYTNQADKTTLKSITSEEFLNLIKKITQYDVTKMPLKYFYKEELFTDLTTKNTIINYATQKDSLAIKNVSILLDPKNTNDLKRIDIKTIYSSADSIISESCSWVVHKEFYIIRYAEDYSGKSSSTKLNVSWKK